MTTLTTPNDVLNAGSAAAPETLADAQAAHGGEDADPVGADSDEAGLQQFVSFHLDRESFAFPMAMVQEIIRVPEMVVVPMTPPALMGLSNLRGVVLPVVDLRMTLGLERVAVCEASRIIVVKTKAHGGAQAIGLVVDRVARVMTVADEAIEPATSVEHGVSGQELIGVLRSTAERDLVQLIDPTGLLVRHFPDLAQSAGGVPLTGPAGGPGGIGEEDVEDDSVQLVSVMLDGEEYAFPIEDVDEIVRVPEQVSRVPGAEAHVRGLISLRNRLLPLICLRRVFERMPSDMGETARVVVLRRSDDTGEDVRVGVIVDQVRAVLKVPTSGRDRLPGVLRRSDRQEIDAICQLENGRRLVSVLSCAALFQLSALREVLEASDEIENAAELQDDAPDMESQEMTETVEAQLVVYQLGNQEFGVDIHSVQEIIRIPETLSRVPRTPDTVEGIINLRGMVLPVVEMRRAFRLPQLDRNDRQRILVLNIDGHRTGYIVDSVSEVLRLPLSAMEPAPRMSEEAARLVTRVANLDHGRRMVLVLEAAPLIEDHGDFCDVEPCAAQAVAS